jgi:hypothetical protein
MAVEEQAPCRGGGRGDPRGWRREGVSSTKKHVSRDTSLAWRGWPPSNATPPRGD